MPQTVTVTVPQDVDVVDETPTITLRATGVLDRIVTVAIADDDPQSIEVTPVTTTLLEGTTASLAVQLAFQPAAPVTVTATSASASVATVTPATLTFTPADYDMPRTVTVRASDDQDTVGGATTIRFEAPPLAREVAVNVTDDDPLLIETDVASVSLSQSTSATFQFRLRAAPVGSLDVIPTSGDVSTATVSPPALTFTAANWNAYQTVTVTGVEDLDVATETVAIALGSSATPTVIVNATVTDPDQQAIVASASSLTVNEGATGTLTVRLRYQPAASVVVAATSSAPAAATASPAMLTFTQSNFATAQTLTITGVDDADTVDASATVTLASAGLTSVPIAVSVDDQDPLLLVLAPATLTINEASSGSIGVRLSAQPSASVSVSLASSDPGAATVAPATLVFTTATWNSVQTVTVTGVDDADVSSESVTVTAAAAGIPTVSATVSVTDDDPLNILTSVGSVQVTEPGSTTFQVRLSQMPPASVTVNVASADTGAATVSPASLSFTTSNWSTYQTVTVQSVNDADLADESVALSLTGVGLMPAAVTAGVTDEDSQSIVLSATTLSVTENATGTITARLAFQPAASVVVTTSSANAAVATAAPATLTFTPANYATPQTVTISGVDDPDAAPGATSVSLSTPSVASASVAVTVTDDDPLLVETSVAAVTIGENGGGTVGVRLTAQPASSVTVNVTSSDTGAATAAPATLTFTASNWATFQNVTLAGVDDADAAHEAVTVTLSGVGVSTRTVPVTVTDDDPLTILTSVGAVSLTEPGTATFTVRLAAQPPATTTVTISSADTGAVTVSPASLTFTTASWNSSQTVTVTAVDDVDMAAEMVALSLTASGIPTATVTASVSDPDPQQVLVTPSSLTVAEGGTGAVSVRLAYQPAGNVLVTVSLDSAIATTSAGTLTFTPASYATGQTLTITGVQDPDGADDSTTLSLTASGATSAAVALTIDDDEPQTIITNVSTISVRENATATFSVRLSAQPTATVTVVVSSEATSEATVSPSQLTFTTSNWNTNQTVTVTGDPDSDSANETTLLSATAPGWTSATVTATVYDDDTLSPSSSSVAMYEQEAAVVLQVRLSAQPQTAVTVGVASNDTGALTVSTSSLAFTTSNWSTYQSVTLTGVNDADTTNETVTVALTATGFSTQNVTVTVHDDDTIALNSAAVTVGEEDTTTFTVRLLAQPRENKVVTVGANLAGVASFTPSSLTFTTSNWSTAQTVSVFGSFDSDRTNDTATIQVSSPNLVQKTAPLTVLEYFWVGVAPYSDNGGSGTVTGSNFSCTVPNTGTCSRRVTSGTMVALHATHAAGSAFWGWENCAPSWSVDCSLVVTADVNVTAHFPRTTLVTVTKSGSGRVKDPLYTALDCGPQCSWDYYHPANVTLQATPDAGWSFAGWTGACTGQGATCTLNNLMTNTTTHAVFTSP